MSYFELDASAARPYTRVNSHDLAQELSGAKLELEYLKKRNAMLEAEVVKLRFFAGRLMEL